MSATQAEPPVLPACVEGATEVRIRRCVGGVWVESWADYTISLAMATVQAGWKPAEVHALLDRVGKCCK